MKYSPKVSIVIPVFNGSNYLNQSIDSALSQSYSNIEVLVVNDGSKDDGATENIALSYGDKIRYFSKENGGVGSALNLAIEKMSGDYFSWLSHDDLYYPDKIESQIKILEGIKNLNTILYSDYLVFFENKVNEINEIHLPHIPPEQFRYFITTSNVLHGCSLLIPKEAFKECGMFNEALRTTQDYDLWFRMAGKYCFTHMPKLLVKARAHAGQGSLSMKDTALVEINDLLSMFARSLTKKELDSATQESAGLAYARISENLYLRGFLSASRTARCLAMRNFFNCSFNDALRIIVIFWRTRKIRGSLN